MRQAKEKKLVGNGNLGLRKRGSLNLLEVLVQEKFFILLIAGGFILAAFAINYAQMAMWLGFLFAAYAAVGNDSIQSLGTFIESNRDQKWYILWLYVGSIFLATVTFSWIYFDGDVTYQRLTSPDGSSPYPHPENFSYFQIIAPLVLLILTRLRMPVSTTFLLLSVFSADSSGITSMVAKSVSGYGLAFVISFAVWYFSYKLIRRYFSQRKMSSGWRVVQWIVSGSLWATWVMQDGANIAVFLPREQSLGTFIGFASVIFLGLGILFYLRGDRIQRVVSEKVRISDIRAATLVDFTYVIMLIYKLFISTTPLSTTWVFLGIIGGREIAIHLSRDKEGHKHERKAGLVILRDFAFAFTGLIISVALATGANPSIREEVFNLFR